MGEQSDVWLFGYGSLIWRPNVPFKEAQLAFLPGWSRYFWQLSWDHRGTPEQPGRVVTLVQAPKEHAVFGRMFRLSRDQWRDVKAGLDHREKAGYELYRAGAVAAVGLPTSGCSCRGGEEREVFVYVGGPDSSEFSPESDHLRIARQIQACVGPSGRNIDYFWGLYRFLEKHGMLEPHVLAVARWLRRLEENVGLAVGRG